MSEPLSCQEGWCSNGKYYCCYTCPDKEEKCEEYRCKSFEGKTDFLCDRHADHETHNHFDAYRRGRLNICDSCGEQFDENELDEINGERLCVDCFNEQYTICTACERTILNDDVQYVRDEPYCGDCYDENFFYCNRCDTDRNNDQAVIVRSGRETHTVCDHCAGEHESICNECEDWVDEDEIHETEEGNMVCNQCASENHRCERCETLHDEGVIVNHNEQNLCSECLSIVQELERREP